MKGHSVRPTGHIQFFQGQSIANWDTEPDLTMDWMVGRKPREVMIPPEKCVFYWLGCERKRFRYNYCRHHYYEARELYPDELGRAPQKVQPDCAYTGCRKPSTSRSVYCRKHSDLVRSQNYYRTHTEDVKARQAQYRAEHAETETERKQAWRDARREHVREYDRNYYARKRDEAASQRGNQANAQAA